MKSAVPFPENFISWQHPAHPSRILIHRTTLELLSFEALAKYKENPAMEIGGWLWGHFDISHSDERWPIITRAEFVPCEGTLYNASTVDISHLGRVLKRAESDQQLSVVGYFRSNIGEDLCLTKQDQQLIEQYVRDPASVFLVIKPFDLGICTAGLFFWQNGRLQTEASDLEIPLVAFSRVQESGLQDAHTAAADLAVDAPDEKAGFKDKAERYAPPAHHLLLPAESRPSEAGTRDRTNEEPDSESGSQSPDHSTIPLTRRRAMTPIVAVMAIVLGILFGAALRVAMYKVIAISDAPADTSNTEVGLRAIRMPDGELHLTWDQNAKDLRNAERGILGIKDGSLEEQWPISARQLRAGTIYYFPNSNSVQIHLEIFLNKTHSVAESLYVPSARGNPSHPLVLATKP